MEMYDEDDEHVVHETVHADLVLDNCDTPAARKMSGTAGHSADVHPCPWCHVVLPDLTNPSAYQQQSTLVLLLDHWLYLYYTDFRYRDDYDMLRQKYHAKDASVARQSTILAMYGVRWAALDWIPGWRPATCTALDFMHCIYLGKSSKNLDGLCRV